MEFEQLCNDLQEDLALSPNYNKRDVQDMQ